MARDAAGAGWRTGHGRPCASRVGVVEDDSTDAPKRIKVPDVKTRAECSGVLRELRGGEPILPSSIGLQPTPLAGSTSRLKGNPDILTTPVSLL